MEQFTDILREATAAIMPHYFLLPIHGADPVYRERVYCYELYHQLRSLWPHLQDCPYSLNGEVDKQNHPYLGQGAPKPDFVVHIPGTGDNYAAIEVKRPSADPEGIRKDIRTLLMFREAGYRRALYLTYGVDPAATAMRIAAQAEEPGHLAAIEVWVHTAPGAPAEMVALSRNV